MKALASIPVLVMVTSVAVPMKEEFHNIWISLDTC